MNRQSRSVLSFEALEDRYCPSLTTVAVDINGNLKVVGTASAPAHTVSMIEDPVLPDVFTVHDGATSYGPFTVTGNINLTLGNVPATTQVVLDLNGNAVGVPGNVTMKLGNFGYDVIVTGGLGAPNGQEVIHGNVAINSGNGNDTVTVDNVTINGNLAVSTGGSFQGGGSAGDTLTVQNGSVINGNVIGSGLDGFELTANGGISVASSVGGSVVLSDFKSNTVNYAFDGSALGNSVVGGSVIVNSNTGFSMTELDISGEIDKSLLATVGKGNSIINVNAGSLIEGNVTLITGTSSPSISNVTFFGGTIGGNVSVLQGTGTNQTMIEAGTTILGHSIRYQGGAGNDTFSFNGFAPAAYLYAFVGTGVTEFDFGPTATLARAAIFFGFGTHTANILQQINFPFYEKAF
jgi:hypothetical protein